MNRFKKLLASFITVLSLIAINPVCANAEWKSNTTGWWYTEGNSQATGWRNINGNWYYFYSDGYIKYKLSFGLCDNLASVVEYISRKYNISINCNQNEIFKFIYSSRDPSLNKMIKDLSLNVTYRFLSQFFRNEIK